MKCPVSGKSCGRKICELAEMCEDSAAYPTREQAVSFAYGNVAMSNPAVTRADVEEAYDKMWPNEERKEPMKESAEKKFRAWLNAPFEEIQRDLDTIAAMRDLTVDDLEQLLAIGRVMADEKRRAVPVPKKRGRPAKKEASNGE